MDAFGSTRIAECAREHATGSEEESAISLSYRQLKDPANEIRLLSFANSPASRLDQQDMISITLATHSLKSCPPYVALSYA